MSISWEEDEVDAGPSEEETEQLFARLQEMLDARIASGGPGTGPSCCGRPRRCRGCPRY